MALGRSFGTITRIYSSPADQRVKYQNSGFVFIDGIDVQLMPGDTLQLTAPLLIHDWLINVGNSQLRHSLDSHPKTIIDLEAAIENVLNQLADLATMTGEACVHP